MAVLRGSFLCAFLFMFTYINCYSVHMKIMTLNETNVTYDSHLKYKHIKELCASRDIVCKSNNTKVCAVRKINESLVYKDFLNACYLFLNNMCDNPGREFSIAWGDSCNEYFHSRRNSDVGKNETSTSNTNRTQKWDIQRPNVTKNIARDGKEGSKELKHTPKPKKTTTPFVTLYEVETSFDEHICPLICPSIYSPVCVTANRGYGKYFKYFSFVNHCAGDLYYCKHWREFEPPPEEDEMVNMSPLGWSYCGSARYLQFARFGEAISALGHYGWLGGNYKYSHIMEPHEKRPGYG